MRDFMECQAFVEHLRSEHEQIQQAFVAVNRDLHTAGSARTRQDLRRLHRRLAEHFAEEEQGGCLEEAVSRVPHLSPDVTAITNEHADILLRIDRLLEQTDDCRTAEFRESFRRFAKVVEAHEAAEDRILHMAFGTGEFETNHLPSLYGE